MFVSSLSIRNFDASIILPVGIGLVIGVIVISYIMNKLLNKYRGITFSLIFGLFISIIPSVLDGHYISEINLTAVICIILVAIRYVNNIFLREIEKQGGSMNYIVKEPLENIYKMYNTNTKTRTN